MPTSLPFVDAPPPERRDAARNREALLEAAVELVRSQGVRAVTMEAVAARAGVGKGTVFRRFGSREGLMAAVLDRSETEWQAAIIGGRPPLGPGAPPLERLLAFGKSRLLLNITHAELIDAAGNPVPPSLEALSFNTMHVRYLLSELGVTGDLPYLASALVAPLDMVVLGRRGARADVPVDRLDAGWADLVHRVTGTT
ncbi:TetR/AcrR family transcriptional regulator [Nocardioides sp. TF02-7]|uniref:TetR/AcrR family transcriptional regulator n=1 Tax=Nocardioides sp. TF02-7 TaxID=2917724 RepID=UPI001F064DD1|nr:TetR/AcrR family transcriptional regulator [Nocardioides sp. TF02-7]UMG93097.1 TetR/AcrR family transcriptional regulator [Nocardioides sp. TF02-7]